MKYFQTKFVFLNNMYQINQAVVLWSPNGSNCNSNSNSNSVTTSPESSGSRETHCTVDSTDSQPVSSPQIESPYYVVSPPSQTHQWGIYPSIPPCPPPQVSYAQQPQQQQQQAVQMPTPLFVTFSDGTTMLVPTHRIHDSNQQQQNPPSIRFKFLTLFRY